MQFDGGATVSFTMIAFTERICGRQTKVYGTKVGHFGLIAHHTFLTWLVIHYLVFSKNAASLFSYFTVGN